MRFSRLLQIKLLTFIILFSACSSTKQTTAVNESFKIMVKIKVFNSQNLPISTGFRLQDLASSKTIDRKDINGVYTTELTSGKLYGFFFDKKGYYTASKNIDARNMLADTTVEFSVEMKSIDELIDKKESVIAGNMFFAKGGSQLLEESNSELESLVSILENFPNINIEIIGHASSEGEVEYNNKLSQERAKSVVDKLIENKIATERLKSYGLGASKPVAPNDIEENRKKNRRVEILFTKGS